MTRISDHYITIQRMQRRENSRRKSQMFWLVARQSVKTSTRLTRQQIASSLGVGQSEANNEISSLVIRGALVADAADSDLFSLGNEAGQWMSPAANTGTCDKVCPSCGVNPCAKPLRHAGMCYCSDCRYGD